MANLVSLAEYKSYVGINSTNQDTELNSIIPKVSQYVKTYCNRSFIDYYNEEKIEYNSGGSTYIYLKESPISVISSVEYSSDYGQTYTSVAEFTYYVYNPQDDRVEWVYDSNGFTKGVNAWKITYTGGFESTPEDLKLAVLDLITYYLKNDMSIKSTRGVGSNNTSIEYITSSSLPSHIRRVLDLYREQLI